MAKEMSQRSDFKGLLKKRRGFCFVVSAPSGAGKTSIVKALLGKDSTLCRSISVTTRPPRPNEEEGIQYYFRTKPEFMQMVEEGKFIEWAHVFEHCYGTLFETVEHNLAQGRDILFDIDWQGHRILKEKLPDDVTSLFVLPPSLDTLKARLSGRDTDSNDVIQYRMSKAQEEISHCREFDYVIVNDVFDLAVEAAYNIVEATRYSTRLLTSLP